MKFIDLTAQYRSIKKDIDKAVGETINNGSFILGKNAEKLEKRIARFTGAKEGVGVASGTDALFLSLKALGVEPGDEVITTPFSFVATAEVIANCGARPVFVDIEPRTFNIDANKIERVITKKTKAVIPVHLYGQMADMAAIMRMAKGKGLAVVEDAAQALGAKQAIANRTKTAGSFGDTACFSFFPTKNLGAYGDAGMIVTGDSALAQKIKMLRNHGSVKKYRHESLSFSSRLDELQAAILLAKLQYLKKWNGKRRRMAAVYNRAFANVEEIQTPFIAQGNNHIYHQYTIRTKKRDELAEFLKQNNVPTAIHYPLPLHLQPAFKYLGYKKGDFPEAERAAKEVLSLSIYPELKKSEQKKIITAVKNFFNAK